MLKKIFNVVFLIYVIVPWSLIYGYFFAKAVDVNYFWVILSSCLWYVGYWLFKLHRKKSRKPIEASL